MTPRLSLIGRISQMAPLRTFAGRAVVFGILIGAAILLSLFPQRYLAATSLTPTDPESLGLSGTLGQLGAINSVFGNQAAVEVAMRVAKSVPVRDQVIGKARLQQRLPGKSWIGIHRWLENSVEIRSLRGGIITIEASNRDPALARDVVAAYAAAVQDWLAQISRKQTAYKRDVLLKLVADANDRLTHAQSAYDAFRRNARYADPRTSIEAIGKRVPQLENAIRAKQVELGRARVLFTDENMVIRQLQAELANLNAQLATAKATDTTNQESVGSLITQTGQLFKLERELGISKALYDSYLRYLQGTAVEDLTSTASVRVLEPAYIDTARQYYLPAAAVALALMLLWAAVEFYNLRPPPGDRRVRNMAGEEELDRG